jgi:hypothetical protein
VKQSFVHSAWFSIDVAAGRVLVLLAIVGLGFSGVGASGSTVKGTPTPPAETIANGKQREIPFQVVTATNPQYQRFREFRSALSDPKANTTPYFAREYLDWVVGSELADPEARGSLKHPDVFRARLRIGSHIDIVHSVFFRETAPGRGDLKLRVSPEEGAVVYTFVIHFIEEGGEARIVGYLIDSTKPIQPGDEGIVERFPKVPE